MKKHPFRLFFQHNKHSVGCSHVPGWWENGVGEEGHRPGHSPLRLPAAGLPAQRPTTALHPRRRGALSVPHVGGPRWSRSVWGRHCDWLERSALGPYQSQGQTDRPQPSVWWDRFIQPADVQDVNGFSKTSWIKIKWKCSRNHLASYLLLGSIFY